MRTGSAALVAALRPDLGLMTERGITVDQTHESVVVGERFVVKWLRDPVPDHPALPVLSHLGMTGFTQTAALAGVLSVPDGVQAIVTEYLPGASDGWDWCIEDLLSGTTGFGGPVGELAGKLHAALAIPSQILKTPVTSAPATASQTWADTARQLLATVLNETDGEDGSWLRAAEPLLKAALELPPDVTGTPLIRVHGDLHVGQLLRWDGGLAVIDFDGNPAVDGRELTQPAARDVAQLMMSLEHVGFAAARRGPVDIEGYITKARGEFLDAYRAALNDQELLDERLLGAFETEQELREVHYANRFLPRWRYAPMAALRRRHPMEDRS
jgi:maltokinase